MGKKNSTREPAERNEKGQFVAGNRANPRGRPAGRSCRALLKAREAAESVALPKLIAEAEAGNLDACKTLLAFGLPKLKPVTLPEPVDLPEGNFTEQIKALLHLVAAGKVASPVASEIAGIVAVAARVDEVTELREELERLKLLLEARKS